MESKGATAGLPLSEHPQKPYNPPPGRYAVLRPVDLDRKMGEIVKAQTLEDLERALSGQLHRFVGLVDAYNPRDLTRVGDSLIPEKEFESRYQPALCTCDPSGAVWNPACGLHGWRSW